MYQIMMEAMEKNKVGKEIEMVETENINKEAHINITRNCGA